MFLRKRSSRERKRMAEGSCHPWATGKIPGVQKQKLQYNIFTSEGFQRHHLKLKTAKKIWEWNTDKSNKQFCGSTGFCPLKRERRVNSADTSGRAAVLRGARGWQRQRHNNYSNQVLHKEEKTSNRSRLFPVSLGPPIETAFSRRSPVASWATPPSGPLCFWS